MKRFSKLYNEVMELSEVDKEIVGGWKINTEMSDDCISITFNNYFEGYEYYIIFMTQYSGKITIQFLKETEMMNMVEDFSITTTTDNDFSQEELGLLRKLVSRYMER